MKRKKRALISEDLAFGLIWIVALILPAADVHSLGMSVAHRNAPSHSDQLLGLQAFGTLRNEGDQTLWVEFTNVRLRTTDDSWTAAALPGGSTQEYRDLRPGTRIDCVVETYRSLHEWKHFLETYSSRRMAVGSIVVNDPFDNGVSDRLNIFTVCHPTGSASELPSEQSELGPRLTTLELLVDRDRLYWRSRRAGMPL
jgi:hypothetical protein